MNKRFWKNKTVLVTGFEGFLGSHLTRQLLSLGAKVVGLDIRVNRKETILSELDYKKLIVVKGSVTNYKLIGDTLDKFGIDIVFHLAAEAIVGRSLKKPLNTFSSNIKGTWNILEACRHSPRVKAVVIASSDKAYGAHRKLPYKEDYALCGKHPYDVSKSCADLLAHSYFHTYGLSVVITRCGNIYGPGEYNFSRIVPDSIRRIISNKPVVIRSDGNYTRDYVYVDDIVYGYLLLAQTLQKLNLAGKAFNLSAESPITVLELVKKICAIAGKHTECKILNKAKYEIRDQYLSAGKAREILGWQPKYTLESGLKKTIRWYNDLFKND